MLERPIHDHRTGCSRVRDADFSSMWLIFYRNRSAWRLRRLDSPIISGPPASVHTPSLADWSPHWEPVALRLPKLDGRNSIQIASGALNPTSAVVAQDEQRSGRGQTLAHHHKHSTPQCAGAGGSVGDPRTICAGACEDGAGVFGARVDEIVVAGILLSGDRRQARVESAPLRYLRKVQVLSSSEHLD